MNCSGCNKDFTNKSKFDYHKKICIYYIYKSTYNTNHSNEIIKNILEMINLFNLHKINTSFIYTKDKLIRRIINEYKILNSFIILDNVNNNNDEKIKIQYIYNYINYQDKENYKYDDILDIITNIYIIPKNDIIDIINSYKTVYISNF